ncbi:unnamed protein product [Arabidopsis lyrata]|uniref:F-box/LRR-repeat protein At3g58930-like n=1 Tax=Arabidopsis lyrata subsp. lyrata TaxID=81972 RepID=UPI000A29E60F|nr:F-box/LRR-repeat protein At3g58930-like [Arabidopsis lyrata subsp. lyrata]XP_020880522.1 F-box/LRR-repeat protein At3g58930-like [Arabidopsis lyrata subsp. lyrata]CAH8269105.1 unnamed protein product [Arabidopsis lyrata]|eukprot:XP_020880521.1 F-box/LRR-repeat protein At3g58930-like [Arabidopsis lyrata subsp. lyrata]
MDRVSTLPDGVLCHILSFLPTKQAALSSVLSKSWLNLWKLVPNLDIDDSEFLHPEEGKGERDEIRQSFVDFVDRVLALQRDSPIKKFSLKSITCVHPDHVNRWISTVLQRGVSDLALFIDFSFEDIEDGYNLPNEMFVSRTLVELKIRSERYVDWWRRDVGGRDRGSVLPMLKTLDIDSEFIYCGEMERFLPSFPVLEKLRMADMEWTESDETVSSASLKKLSIHGTGCEGFRNPKSISFDTPSLLSFNYSDLVAEDYPLVNMKALFEARINFIVTENQIKRVRAPNDDSLEDDEGDVILRFGNVVKLMNGIQSVQKLYLTADTLEVLSLCCESVPLFNNLKTLGITSEEDRGWQAMPVILRKCPYIEFLLVEGLLHYVTDKCGDACDCIFREDKGRSLTSCPVKKLEIRGFRGTIKEMTMIKHFLVYFPCLKDMNIYVEENDPTELRFPEVSKVINQIMEEYNKFSSCNVQLLVTDYLSEKWTAKGRIL